MNARCLINSASRCCRRLALLLSLVLLLSGCASVLSWTPEYHEVRSGETLTAIAWQYRLDPDDIAAWNGLGDGNLIRVGQRLRLRPPEGGQIARSRTSGAGRKGAPPPPPPEQPVGDWNWPTAGPVITAFGAEPRADSGIEIGGREGQKVRAAAPGEVVYAGSGLVGFGQLVIIKHNETFLSAYGHNAALLVAEGDLVMAGQGIGEMGVGPTRQPMLYFEIRRNGQPVNPVQYLPRR